MNTCPHCNRPVEEIQDKHWLPFCSERCKLIDLGDWMSGNQVIPGEEGAIIPDQDDTHSH